QDVGRDGLPAVRTPSRSVLVAAWWRNGKLPLGEGFHVHVLRYCTGVGCARGTRLVVARRRGSGRPRAPRAAAATAADATARLTLGRRAGAPVAPDLDTGRTTYRLARHARTRRPHHRRR